MNMQLSQGLMSPEEVLSNGGGFDLLKRGISPVAGNPHDATIPDSLSNFGYNGQQVGGDPGAIFSQTFLEYSDI